MRFPGKRTSRKKIVTFQMDGMLLGKVVKRVEFMSSLEIFAIFFIAFV